MVDTRLTPEQAIANAARLFAQAELELTNLSLMERLDELAITWVRLAEFIAERERI